LSTYPSFLYWPVYGIVYSDPSSILYHAHSSYKKNAPLILIFGYVLKRLGIVRVYTFLNFYEDLTPQGV